MENKKMKIWESKNLGKLSYPAEVTREEIINRELLKRYYSKGVKKCDIPADELEDLRNITEVVKKQQKAVTQKINALNHTNDMVEELKSEKHSLVEMIKAKIRSWLK